MTNNMVMVIVATIAMFNFHKLKSLYSTLLNNYNQTTPPPFLQCTCPCALLLGYFNLASSKITSGLSRVVGITGASRFRNAASFKLQSLKRIVCLMVVRTVLGEEFETGVKNVMKSKFDNLD